MEVADVVAHEMKEWAIEKGATHYSHWFQPLTGVTAEKHDAFITAPKENGKVLMSFSGKELIKENPMRLHSRQVGFEQLLRQEDIQRGTVRHRLLYVMMRPAERFAFLPHSVLIQEKHLIRKHRFCVLWKLLIHSLYDFSDFLEIRHLRK